MPVFLLSDELLFPPPELASEDGLVAVGGDVGPERLILAYAQGIFPWPVRGMPLLWFSPDPRFVLRPHRMHLSRSLRKRIRRGVFVVTADRALGDVMRECARVPRRGQDGTWITSELVDGYSQLHDRGLAHSVEAWRDGELAGGLYGVSLGAAFFGESMFARASDASKVAFVTLVGNLVHWGISLVDCQVYTEHIARFGAEDVPRADFLQELRSALEEPTREGRWELSLGPAEAVQVLDALDGRRRTG